MKALQIFLSFVWVAVVVGALYVGRSYVSVPETIEEIPRPWEWTSVEDRSARAISTSANPDQLSGPSRPPYDCIHEYAGPAFTPDYAGGEIATSLDFEEAIHSLSYWHEVAARDHAGPDMPSFLNDVVQLAPPCERVIVEVPVLTHQARLDYLDWIDMRVSRTRGGTFKFVEVIDVSRPGIEGAISFAQDLGLLEHDLQGSVTNGNTERAILYVRMVPADFYRPQD